MKTLIETVFSANNNQKVTLVAVSYGPQITLGFLHRMTQKWKDTFVHAFVAESPVWSGAPASLGITTGLDPKKYPFPRPLILEVYGCMWLFPLAGNTKNTYGRDYPLIITPSKNYTAFDYADLYSDLGLWDKIPGMLAAQTHPDLVDFKSPGLDTFVVFGYGIPTVEQFVYNTDFVPGSWPQARTVKNAPDTGDEIVTVRSSLRALYEWPPAFEKENKTLHYKGYKEQTHAYCLNPDEKNGFICFHDVLNYIVSGIIPPPAMDWRDLTTGEGDVRVTGKSVLEATIISFPIIH